MQYQPKERMCSFTKVIQEYFKAKSITRNQDDIS